MHEDFIPQFLPFDALPDDELNDLQFLLVAQLTANVFTEILRIVQNKTKALSHTRYIRLDLLTLKILHAIVTFSGSYICICDDGIVLPR